MEYFSIFPDDENWGKLYNDDLVANYIWSMPGVHCPACKQIWALTGVSYPLVDLSSTSIGEQLKKPRVVELQEYESLLEVVKQFVPNELPVFPGTNFGPLKGRIAGNFGDFVWWHLWDPLIRVDVYKKLITAGLRLPEYTNPILQKNVQGKLIQLQIAPIGYLSSMSYSDSDKPSCPRCKRDSRKFEKILKDIKNVPSFTDIFRIGDFPTKILVSQRFKDIVCQFGFTNIKFERLET